MGRAGAGRALGPDAALSPSGVPFPELPGRAARFSVGKDIATIPSQFPRDAGLEALKDA